MKDEWMLGLSVLVDGEGIPDAAILAEALADPEGREALLQLVRLRATVQADESRPGPQFYETMRPALRAPEPWSGRKAVRGLAAAVVLVLGAAGLIDLGLRLRGEKPADQPPQATRVLRFEPGVDWHSTAR